MHLGHLRSEHATVQILNDFERVDHAVLAVGWVTAACHIHGIYLLPITLQGEDAQGNKHWILKNSYGSNWGENGYFKVPRGGDVDGILSLVSAAQPVLGDSSYFAKQAEAEQQLREADGLRKPM